MKKTRIDELLELREALGNLQKFIRYFSGGELPYFYRMLDYMKNNIEIYLQTGEKDFISLNEILYRDWCEANNLWYGIPAFHISQKVCRESVELYYQYAILVHEVARYFDEE